MKPISTSQKTKTPSSPAPKESPKPPVAASTPTTPPPRDRSKPYVVNPVEVGPMPNSDIIPMPS